MDYFIGAMLYCGYRVEYVGDRYVAGIAKASPLKKIFCGKIDKNKPESRQFASATATAR